VINYSSVLIIYNPNAMRGRVEDYMPRIKQRLSLRYATVEAMSSPEIDGAEAIATRYASKYDILVVCGGDGTLHRVINGVLKTGANPVIGLLPFGTCNDVAHTLGLPHDIDKAVDAILRLNTTEYDIMYDGNEYIAYSLATGYLTKSTYTATNKSKKRFGRLAYFFSAIKCLFKFDSLPITVVYDGERVHGKFVYFMILNSQYAGGFHLNKEDDVNNGKVRLVLIKKTNAFASFFAFVKLFMFGIKSLLKSKCVIVKDVKRVEIENHANAPFTQDGEKIKFLKKQIAVKAKLTMIKK